MKVIAILLLISAFGIIATVAVGVKSLSPDGSSVTPSVVNATISTLQQGEVSSVTPTRLVGAVTQTRNGKFSKAAPPAVSAIRGLTEEQPDRNSTKAATPVPFREERGNRTTVSAPVLKKRRGQSMWKYSDSDSSKYGLPLSTRTPSCVVTWRNLTGVTIGITNCTYSTGYHRSYTSAQVTETADEGSMLEFARTHTNTLHLLSVESVHDCPNPKVLNVLKSAELPQLRAVRFDVLKECADPIFGAVSLIKAEKLKYAKFENQKLYCNQGDSLFNLLEKFKFFTINLANVPERGCNFFGSRVCNNLKEANFTLLDNRNNKRDGENVAKKFGKFLIDFQNSVSPKARISFKSEIAWGRFELRAFSRPMTSFDARKIGMCYLRVAKKVEGRNNFRKEERSFVNLKRNLGEKLKLEIIE